MSVNMRSIRKLKRGGDVLLHEANDGKFDCWDAALGVVSPSGNDAQFRGIGHDSIVQGLLDFLYRFLHFQAVHINDLRFWLHIVRYGSRGN